MTTKKNPREYKWPSPPKIEAIFGPKSKYRVTLDPSYDAEKPEFRPEEKPWLRRVACRAGHLFVQGTDAVGYSGTGGRMRAKLLAIPGVKSAQTGDEEFSVVFPPSALPAVARVVKPRTKRTLSDKQKAESAARLATYRFSKIPAQPRS